MKQRAVKGCEHRQAPPVEWRKLHGAVGTTNLLYSSRPGDEVSVHRFVDKDGAVHQSVRFEEIAWTVGYCVEN